MSDTAPAHPAAAAERALAVPLADLARRAGAAILGFRPDRVAVAEKPDRSPVTAADRTAEAIILDGLAALDPGAVVIAEESPAGRPDPAAAGARFWLVDPLDGTREFLAGRDEFTVNIALIRDGEPVLGVVYVPARDELYAAAGGTAWQERDGRPRAIRARPRPATGLIAVASRSHGSAEERSFLDRLGVVETVNAGSSLKFCLIAAGGADVYPRRGRTMEWDTAAGDAVLRAAGGRTETWTGGRLAYGKPDWTNPAFVAWGAPGSSG